MKELYTSLLPVFLSVTALLFLGCILRAVRGPGTADRMVAVNMMTTLGSLSVCVLTLLLAEDYLADIALLFSLVGSLAVIVLTRILSELETRKRPARKEESPHVD